MRRSGSPPWGLSVSDEATLVQALFIRDALRLDTSGDPLAPPPLMSSRPPDRSHLLGGQSRAKSPGGGTHGGGPPSRLRLGGAAHHRGRTSRPGCASAPRTGHA